MVKFRGGNIKTQKELKQLMIREKRKGNLKRYKKKSTVIVNLDLIKKDNLDLGYLDNTEYTDKYIKENSNLAIQRGKENLDYYLVSNEVFKNKYIHESDICPSYIPDDIKPYASVYNQGDQITEMLFCDFDMIIEAPWGGTQESIRGSCFLVLGNDEVYMVQDSDGLPINYEEVK